MIHHHRVTKYNPAFRDPSGAYLKDEWTAFSEIGRFFDGKIFTRAEYDRTEDAYVAAIEGFLSEAGITELRLRGLENARRRNVPDFVVEGRRLNLAACALFARLALREVVWGKLTVPGRAYVHFGWDYYLFIGVPRRCPKAIEQAEASGLFVENVRSPSLRRV